MPGKARIVVPNTPHHIVQRGHNKQVVFVSDDDYQYYLENVFEWKEQKINPSLFSKVDDAVILVNQQEQNLENTVKDEGA